MGKPIVPSKAAPRWLYEILRSLSNQSVENTEALAAVGRGENPDGSGLPIVDTSQYWFKPGIPGGQVGYGGIGPGEDITWSSTRSSTKGNHYFGTLMTFDEANTRLGVGTASPTAVLHLRQPSGAVVLQGSSSGPNAWQLVTTPGLPTVWQAVQTNDGDTSYLSSAQAAAGTYNFEVVLNGAVANGGTYTINFWARRTGTLSADTTLSFFLRNSAGVTSTAGNGGVFLTPSSSLTTLFALYSVVISGSFGGSAGTANSLIVSTTYGSNLGNRLDITYLDVTSGTGTAGDLARWDGPDGSTQHGKIAATGYFGIGTGSSTPSGLVHLKTDAVGTVPLWIQLLTAQTADVLRVQDAANTSALAGLTAAGNYYLVTGGTAGRIYTSQGAGVGAWASASSLATRVQFEWRANGPYQVGTSVDGGINIPTGFTISSVRIYRTTAGTSGSTIVDLNKDTGAGPVTMYTTQGNRPTILFNDADKRVTATLPDILSVAAGDVLTIDIDQIEGGNPYDLVVIIEGA